MGQRGGRFGICAGAPYRVTPEDACFFGATVVMGVSGDGVYDGGRGTFELSERRRVGVDSADVGGCVELAAVGYPLTARESLTASWHAIKMKV
jgi:hypothetical protein